MSVIIRPADENEQVRIKELIKQAHINQRNIHWKNFTVAEDSGQIVGLRQVKHHKAGTREVASGYVISAYRHQGISARLMEAVLDKENGPLFLMCDKKWSGYYQRFGFEPVGPKELPNDFGREYRLARIITRFLSLLARRKLDIIPMKRPSPPSEHHELAE